MNVGFFAGIEPTPVGRSRGQAQQARQPLFDHTNTASRDAISISQSNKEYKQGQRDAKQTNKLYNTSLAHLLPQTKPTNVSSKDAKKNTAASNKNKARLARNRPAMHIHRNLDPISSDANSCSSGSSRRQSTVTVASDNACTGTRGISSATGTPSRLSINIPAASGTAGRESAPLTVADAIVGLVAASCQAQSDLTELNTAPQGKTQPLQRVLAEVKSFKLTAQLVHKYLRRSETGSLEHASRCSMVDLDVLVAIVAAAILTISELESRLEDLVTQADDLQLSTEEMCVRFTRSLAKDANRINTLEYAFSKILSVMQVSNAAEAKRHREQAQEMVMDMLQADAALAARMQQLEDTYHGRDLVSGARQAELASRPPPGYSVPSPTDDELPDYAAAMFDDSVQIVPRDWSIYSGLNLADIPDLSKIALPVILGEVKDNNFYTTEYAQSVNDALCQLAEQDSKHKSKSLSQILGIKNSGSTPESQSQSQSQSPPESGGLFKRLAHKVGSSRRD